MEYPNEAIVHRNQVAKISTVLNCAQLRSIAIGEAPTLTSPCGRIVMAWRTVRSAVGTSLSARARRLLTLDRLPRARRSCGLTVELDSRRFPSPRAVGSEPSRRAPACRHDDKRAARSARRASSSWSWTAHERLRIGVNGACGLRTLGLSMTAGSPRSPLGVGSEPSSVAERSSAPAHRPRRDQGPPPKAKVAVSVRIGEKSRLFLASWGNTSPHRPGAWAGKAWPTALDVAVQC